MNKLTWDKNPAFKYAAFKMILEKNYGIDDRTDIKSLFDSTLTIRENLSEALATLKAKKSVSCCPSCGRLLK